MEYFSRTLYSFFICCHDFERIDSFEIVDDGNSAGFDFAKSSEQLEEEEPKHCLLYLVLQEEVERREVEFLTLDLG